MLVSTLDFSNFLGRIAIGRIERGRVRVGDQVALLPLGEPGLVAEEAFERNRVTRLYTFDGLNRVEVDVAGAGDIVALSGFETIEIGKTFTSVDAPERLAGHRGRGAHDLGGLHRQQQPVCRPRREVRHQPPAQGPAVPGAGAERGAPGRGDRQPRHPHRRRAAASSTSAS